MTPLWTLKVIIIVINALSTRYWNVYKAWLFHLFWLSQSQIPKLRNYCIKMWHLGCSNNWFANSIIVSFLSDSVYKMNESRLPIKYTTKVNRLSIKLWLNFENWTKEFVYSLNADTDEDCCNRTINRIVYWCGGYFDIFISITISLAAILV